ncbi:hypothetical protein [Methanobrevibacter sp.]|uniref:hypothetical protein n=1 Tax=Methanobrevibacter sp. TaxID=66852 RepID=UPI00388CF021
MASRSAIVLVILLVSVIAFCFAGAFAAMTGTYHLNFNFGNHTNDTGFFGNLTDFNSDHSSSSQGSVQTYSDSGSSSSNVETKEDTTPTPDPSPSPTPDPSPTPTNRTAKGV